MKTIKKVIVNNAREKAKKIRRVMSGIDALKDSIDVSKGKLVELRIQLKQAREGN